MAFNPEIHHRRSIRLRDYDYSRDGAYFVTICTWQRESLFGEVTDGENQWSNMGQVVQECWAALPEHFPHVELDAFVIMPNHVHGILVLNDDRDIVGARHASPDLGEWVRGTDRATHASPLRRAGPKSRSIGAIVGSFKSAVTKRINLFRDNPGKPVWQRNYFERVIRDERELEVIRQYFVGNPSRWEEDENHPVRVLQTS
jgi:putative transposase